MAQRHFNTNRRIEHRGHPILRTGTTSQGPHTMARQIYACTIAVFIGVSALSSFVRAQAASATFSGTVLDESSHVRSPGFHVRRLTGRPGRWSP
jgi:hypothetical protein